MKALIDSAWENRAEYSPGKAPADLLQAVEECLNGLNPDGFAWPSRWVRRANGK